MQNEQLQTMTIKQLKAYCKSHQISGYSGLCKTDIINLILNKPIPTKKEFNLNKTELISPAALQLKKVDELRFICRQMGLIAYQKTKSAMIANILQQHNGETKVATSNTNTTSPKIIQGQQYELDSNDDISFQIKPSTKPPDDISSSEDD